MKLFNFFQNKITASSIVVLLIFSVALFPVLSVVAIGEEQTTAAEQTTAEKTTKDAAAEKAKKEKKEKEDKIATETKKKEQEKLEEAKEKYKEKEDAYKKANASVASINGEIKDLETDIIDTIEDIQKLQAQIEKQQENVDKLYNNFKGRLKSIYMSGSYTDIQALLMAEDFVDYLTKSEMIKAVSEKDAAAIQEMQQAYSILKKKQDKVKKDRVKLEVKEADLQTSKADLELKKAEAAKAYNESIDYLKEVNKSEEATKVQIEKEQKELEKIVAMCKKEAEISNDIAKAIKSGKYKDIESEIISNGGQLCFPVPSCTEVSCGFYGYTNHNGMDFANMKINGQKVVAAKAGKIMSVKLLDYSYGHHVWINHGGNTATLYAHMSRIVVKEGQYVKQGQVIGYVGSTGNSIGPHLHFGYLVDGQFVNPLNYF
ncbi:MAG: peptidoglycan DD-metalloendopeptidase family protein [Clostridia bacterium]|nr:peptidoglycan DD-metalloendopeptidase family protein [Clostridia bacterium]